MAKKKMSKKKYMKAPTLSKTTASEVLDRNNHRCCNCNKPISKNDVCICYKTAKKRSTQPKPDELKAFCKKCAHKYATPYVNPNKQPKPIKTYNDKAKETTRPQPISKQANRKRFTPDEREQVLKNTYGICACCGKKLTLDTMTVEHIIPIAENGTNDMENLTALCFECNHIKNNDLYIAEGFYSALVNKPRFKEIASHVKKWFTENCNKLNLTKNPLISPHFNVFHVPFGLIRNPKQIKYSTQILYQYSFVSPKDYGGIKQLTGVNTDKIIKTANKYNGTKIQNVALYTLKKISNDKTVMVIAVLYDPKRYQVTFYVPWSDIKNDVTNASFTRYIAYNCTVVLTTIADKPIDEIIIKHHNPELTPYIVHAIASSGLALGYYTDETEPDLMHFVRYLPEDDKDYNEDTMKPSLRKQLKTNEVTNNE